MELSSIVKEIRQTLYERKLIKDYNTAHSVIGDPELLKPNMIYSDVNIDGTYYSVWQTPTLKPAHELANEEIFYEVEDAIKIVQGMISPLYRATHFEQEVVGTFLNFRDVHVLFSSRNKKYTLIIDREASLADHSSHMQNPNRLVLSLGTTKRKRVTQSLDGIKKKLPSSGC